MIEIDPKTTNRKQCFEYFIDAPMPMLTAFKKIDIKNAVKLSKKGYRLNGILCYAILKAAENIDEFYYILKDKKLFRADTLNVSVVVRAKSGEFLSCEIPFSSDFKQFYTDYDRLMNEVYSSGVSHEEKDGATIGTSTILTGSIDGLVNLYTPIFSNPFVVWSRYENKVLSKPATFTLQFHHAQMDGGEAANFFENLTKIIKNIKSYI